MIPNSAFITVGESQKNLDEVAAGLTPGAEYSALRRRGAFSQVIAMKDHGIDASAFGAMSRFAADAYAKSWNHENIYLGEEFPGIQYLAAQAVLRRKKRIVMLVHNVASLRRRLPLATLRLASFADHLLCLSERSREELETQYRFPGSRISVIGSRVDTEFFTPDSNARVQNQVCAAGAVNRDYDTLIDAVRELGVPTKIAADTAWKHSTGHTSEPQGAPARPDFVEMRSWGNYRNLRQLYAESAVVVVPLRRALLSGVTVALEGMAMGKAVILTHNPYVQEFLRDGENGYFVPAGDARALREKIRHVLDHPAEAARVGSRAREWVLERFTVERYVERILGVW
jgi:glycosyltransferase involved in cell wall biosynthesis